ncbi:MAG: tRNA 2-thiouridine(34) synthase MnmA [Mariprofundales bacterium]|nr:tRNA 2-thiouridine(34) synthase MnmA [Mariprofundales bacterium]
MNKINALRGRKVIAAMSGGVDSSVVAALLHQQGAEVIGVFLQVWDYQREEVSRHGSCCALEDAYDARRVADKLGIPFYSMDMREAFEHAVVRPFVAGYAEGRTPNPCERCNRFVKFGALLKAADELGVEWIATGHYVRRVDDAAGSHLLCGVDTAKDQSYFLATTKREALDRLLFPLGEMCKPEVRHLATEFGLPTAEKQESQDICFIPNGDRAAFLQHQGVEKGFRRGDIVTHEGSVLGQHDGIAHFTMGQRRGLGLSGGPWRVVGLDAERAQVMVAPADDATLRRVWLTELNAIAPQPWPQQLQARIRYRGELEPCHWQREGDGLRLTFVQPVAVTAPGQVAALYVGDEVIAGGIIDRVEL